MLDHNSGGLFAKVARDEPATIVSLPETVSKIAVHMGITILFWQSRFLVLKLFYTVTLAPLEVAFHPETYLEPRS